MSAPPPAREFIEIKDPHSVDFEQLWRIYEEALPACERKPREAVAAMVAREDYRVMVMKEEAQVLAFLMVFVSLSADVALLEYLATSPHLRNQGLGAVMFQKAAEMAGTRPLLVEFDSEREDSPDRELRLRRKSFYLRQGCQQIEHLDYLMPQVGDSKPPVMDLAYYWQQCETAPSARLIHSWLETIYTEVYGRSGDDPGIAAMMGGHENTEASETEGNGESHRRD